MHLTRSMNVLVVVFSLLCGISVLAQEGDSGVSEKVHETSLGLSYVAYTGNSHGETVGFDMHYKRIPTPWGLEFEGKYLRTRDTGETTAEQSRAWLKGSRAFGKRWELEVSALAEGDRFSGIDRRYMLVIGARYKALLGPRHVLYFDGGLTPVREKYEDETDRSYLGGILSTTYEWKVSDNSLFVQKIIWYPDLERSVNWRAEMETSIQASITTHLALKASYNMRYDNEPAIDFKKTDTTTKLSLVFSF